MLSLSFLILKVVYCQLSSAFIVSMYSFNDHNNKWKLSKWFEVVIFTLLAPFVMPFFLLILLLATISKYV